jgi:hypothetical protein
MGSRSFKRLIKSPFLLGNGPRQTRPQEGEAASLGATGAIADMPSI